MANLDSSWQASVIKLAQTGNSRAIAFWLNRELVPQGVCAQIAAEPSGCLVIRIVSRQTPDCDKLVQYICHRLCKLDSAAIQQVRITAQMVGSSELLWEKSAQITPVSAQQAAPVGPVPSQAVSSQAERVAVAVQAAVAQASASQASITPGTPAPTAVAQLDPVIALVNETSATAPSRAEDKLERKLERKAPTPIRKAARHGATPEKPGIWAKLKLPFAQPTAQSITKSGKSVDRKISKGSLKSQLQALKLSSLDMADHSIRWFMTQKPAGRALILGGSAVSAFLIGCSFELAGYYVNPAAFQRSKATLTGMFRNVVPSGSVQTVSERISIIRQPVLNPDDPTISLVFSNSDLLTRLPASQRLPNQVNPETALATTVEAYRQADMLITNLNHPVISTTDSEAAKSAKSTELTKGSKINPSVSPEAGTAPQLTGLPEEDLDEAKALAGDSDHEAEKMNFIAEDEATTDATSETGETDPTATTAEADKKHLPLTPQELVANRVNLVNLASSAVMPDGQTQLNQELNLLKQGKIYAVGAGQSLPEARRPQIFEVKGKRIAYLGYSDSSPRAASGITAGVNVSVNRQMQADIEAIRDQVDWVVVSFNWNRELRAYPEDWQINLTHAAVDYGADLVVGYHPTATQGGELYNGRAIVYSLGDAIDEYSEKPAGSYEAAALKVTLKDHVMQLEFLPLQVKQGQAQAAQGETATKILQYIQQASSLFDQPLRSPTSLNSQVRLTLPAAPNSEMQTDPFISYPSPESSSDPKKPQP